MARRPPPDSTVTVRTVTVGATEGDDSEIVSGLVPGEAIVLTGVDKLQEGTKVKAQFPASNSSQDPAQKSAARAAKGK